MKKQNILQKFVYIFLDILELLTFSNIKLYYLIFDKKKFRIRIILRMRQKIFLIQKC